MTTDTRPKEAVHAPEGAGWTVAGMFALFVAYYAYRVITWEKDEEPES